MKDIGFPATKSSLTQMDANVKLTKEYGELLTNPVQYMKTIGKLLYLTITRLYLSYSVNYLRQFMSSPRVTHLKVVH